MKPWIRSADPFLHQGPLLLPLDQVLCPRHTQRPSTARLLLIPSPQTPGALPAFPPGQPPTDALGRAASPGAHAGAPSSSSSHTCPSGRCLGLSLTPPGAPHHGFHRRPQSMAPGSRSTACWRYPTPTPDAPLVPPTQQSFPSPIPVQHNYPSPLNGGLDSIVFKLLKFFIILIFSYYL